MKAFPITSSCDHEGMDLRDYYAAAALQGLLANPKLASHILKEGGAYGGWIEHAAFGWADAMMEARGSNDK
jgi:hypothetical protein